uniref:Uncharacterized protein n=1 Tax=Magallana gigas TaxID=29159 RepID=A0A8W8JND6_MAGGI|nr:uncharacterized protein LOC117691096 [Crassostrea gigas]
MEKAGFESRLRSLLVDYFSSTNTRTMTPVRNHILQILIFLYGKENIGQLGGFSYSKNKEVADQQRKYILFAFLFMEALKKNTVTETDLTTLQRMWGQHLLSLVNNGMEKAAEKYERILHDSEETIFNIKRFQRSLQKIRSNDTGTRTGKQTNPDHVTPKAVTPFSFRRPRMYERIAMALRNVFGSGDPKDFFMLKFSDSQ